MSRKENYDFLRDLFNKEDPLKESARDFPQNYRFYGTATGTFMEDLNKHRNAINDTELDQASMKKSLLNLMDSFFFEYFKYNTISIDASSILVELLCILQKAGFSDEDLQKYNDKFIFEAKLRVFSTARDTPKHQIPLFWDILYLYVVQRKMFYTNPCIRVDLFKDSLAKELDFQKSFFISYRNEILAPGNSPPRFFYTWVDFCIFAYHNCVASFNYTQFINEIIVLSISISRSNCDFDTFSSCVLVREQFKTELERNRLKKKIRQLNGLITGYGEKPLRLLVFFGILSIVFSGIYFYLPGIEGLPPNGLDRFISSLYFFVTTSLTIGYGEIHVAPGYNVATVIVMINEILGFVIGGSLIALYLRKIFRY